MTSDLCSEDVVVRITTPQIITSPTVVSGSAGAGGGSASRGVGCSAGVELGRRLLLAARGGDTAQVLELMAKGAPFSTDWLGTSALHLAAAHAHADTCAVLVRAGVSRDARTKVERTPLHVAACAGHARVVRLLLAAGAAVDVRDMLRMTPLHWAVQRGHAAAARDLLRHGADPHAVSKFHKTPHSLALETQRDDIVRLIEDAIKEREAARSVTALVNEQMEDVPEPQIQTFESVQRIQDLNFSSKSKPTTKTEKTTDNKTESVGVGSEEHVGAAQLLRRHGITLLPTDDGSTVLNALQSGRTVVLSDAGKLMLKESSETSPVVVTSKACGGSTSGANIASVTSGTSSTSATSATSGTSSGVVLTATPVRSPPKPGVKIFTLNNKLLAVPKDNKIPVKKIINPQDMQVKFLQLHPDAKIISPSKLVPLKAKSRVVSRAAGTAGQRPAVKIIMNKNNFNRFLANAAKPTQQQKTENNEVSTSAGVGVGDNADDNVGDNAGDSVGDNAGDSVGESAGVCVGECSGVSAGCLRAQLSGALRALQAARHELRVTRAKLAHYERLHALH